MIAHKQLQSGVVEMLLMKRYYSRAAYHHRRATANRSRASWSNFVYYFGLFDSVRIALNIPANPTYGYLREVYDKKRWR